MLADDPEGLSATEGGGGLEYDRLRSERPILPISGRPIPVRRGSD